MKALFKAVGQPWKQIEIENTLKALQEAVDGYIETVRFAENATLICDEEGWLKDKPFNIFFLGAPLAGDLLIVGVKGEDFCAVPDEVVKWLA